ncbi:MAG: hypothetical protein ACYDFT_03745, partial [Thermoplasmata archaeon]
MSAPASSDVVPTVLVLIIVVFVFGRRLVAVSRGSRLTTGRLVAYALFVTVIFGLAIVAGYSVLPWYVLPIDLLVAVLAAAVGATFVGRRVEIREVAPGRWNYRLGAAIPVLYL